MTISGRLSGNFGQKVIDELSAQQENHGGSGHVDDSRHERVPSVRSLWFGFIFLYLLSFFECVFCFCIGFIFFLHFHFLRVQGFDFNI